VKSVVCPLDDKAIEELFERHIRNTTTPNAVTVNVSNIASVVSPSIAPARISSGVSANRVTNRAQDLSQMKLATGGLVW